MLVTLLIMTTAVGAPLRVDEALGTLSVCEEYRSEACQFAAAWVRMGGDGVLPQIVAATPDMTPVGQILTISAVNSNTSVAATNALGSLVREPRVILPARLMALEQLVLRVPTLKRPQPTVAVGCDLANDEDVRIRRAAVTLVASRATARDKRAVQVLLAAAQDADAQVRVAAMTGLGQCKCKESPPPLQRALSDANLDVRLAAAEGLTKIKHPSAIPDLVAALGADDEPLNQTLARALRFQSGQKFGDDAQQWRRWLASR